MTPPDWLQDPTVKVYAAKHLPVVRVGATDSEGYGPLVFVRKYWEPLPAFDWPELCTAWERLKEDQYKLQLVYSGWTGPNPTVSMPVPDGFYYLKPELMCDAPDHGDLCDCKPHELVPCGNVMVNPDIDISVIIADALKHNAALIFHLPKRGCDFFLAGEGIYVNGTLRSLGPDPEITLGTCHRCDGTGTIPERVHVETREV